ncbi:SCO family protein [Geothrix sp.]|uniref:SCO family protein n=1 Tax=Geothrix sp. TaxID=1962974 RepID=UPI0025B89570|nr:SCO family protein [Geothrix sp.]WIL20961.1 MAG: SCO family protein [Geothrix sp.]
MDTQNRTIQLRDFGMNHRTRTIPALVFSLGALSATGLAAQTPAPYTRSTESYSVPDVTLVDQDGMGVSLKAMLESREPVIVDFIFGTCTTICPVLSAGYANLQLKRPPGAAPLHLVSISIDPEHDTPKVMRDYLKRYRSRPGWQFLTGRREDIDKVMRAFNAYIPNKMAHYPLTFIRVPRTGKWTRIFGLMSSTEFVAECRKEGIL